jgi:Holliday junction resolvasome RuvABC endonuclease subunit
VAQFKTILGIDPGLDKLGWGCVLEWDDKGLSFNGCGIIETTKPKSLFDRLLEIKVAVRNLLHKLKPDAVVIEEYFVNGANKDGIHTCKAIGVITSECAAFGIETIVMYSPITLKSTIGIKRPKKDGSKGFEKVDKKDVQNGVNSILLTNFSYPTAKCHQIDAVGLALCHIKGKKPLDYGV